MANCSVRWRSSGGRGEFEFVPAESLDGRTIAVLFEPQNITIPAEVYGARKQGKPRLRKDAPNDRKKFHLPQLVMAVARLPEPAREDTTHGVVFPLENKSFVMESMDFDIIDDDGITATLSPLRVSILHSDITIDLQDRLTAIQVDNDNISLIKESHPGLAAAIQAHKKAVQMGVNDISIRKAADLIITEQAHIFGMTNAASIITLDKSQKLPPADIEDTITGKEGRLLSRIHYYKERDRGFVKKVKSYYKSKNGGKLVCEACGLDPDILYGPNSDNCIEAHHKIPIEALQPDSVTQVKDMAMVCASCHRIIHKQKPCLLINEVCL